MPTNDLQINFYDKKLLSLTGLSAYFLTYLSDKIDERTSAIFQQTSGVLDADEIEINASGPDEFDLDITNAARLVVGTGEIIDLDLLNGAGLTTDIPIENELGVTYYVGIKYMQIMDGIEVNPRTADPEYPTQRDSYGEIDNPTGCSDNFGVALTLNVNSITESGVDHSGRTVKVYLVDPVSPVEATAYYEGQIVYNSPNNELVIPYSGGDGPLGQDTSVDPPSTTTGDYIVAIEGVTWRRNTDLRLDSDYAFIGLIIGGGAGNPIGATDVSDQVPIFINTLDRAYDGAVGAGSGRLIFVDNEAVELRARAGGTDELHASLRVDRKAGSEDGGTAIQTIAGESDGPEAPVMHFIPLTHSAGGVAADIPADSTSSEVIERTGSENFQTANVNMHTDYAWLQGFSTIDGLYQINDYSASDMQLRNMDGTPPSFPIGDGPGVLTILRAVASVTNTGFGGIDPVHVTTKGGMGLAGNNEAGGSPASGQGGYDETAALTIIGNEVDVLHVYEYVLGNPLVATWINSAGSLATCAELLVAPSSDIASQSTPQGITFIAYGYNGMTPIDYIPATGESLYTVSDPGSQLVGLRAATGMLEEPHVFRDDFHYHPNTWTGPTTGIPPHYWAQTTVNGTCRAADGGALPAELAGTGGAARVYVASGAGGTVTLYGPPTFLLDTDKNYLHFKQRSALDSFAESERIAIGIQDILTSSWRIRFEVDLATHGDKQIWLVVDDNSGGTPTEKVSTGSGFFFPGANPAFWTGYISIIGHTTVRYWVNGMAAPLNFTVTGFNFQATGALVGPYAEYDSSYTTGDNGIWIDFWELRNNIGLIAGGGVYPF